MHGVADHEVEDDGAHGERQRVQIGHQRQTGTGFLEVATDSFGRVEADRAASGQEDGVNLLDGVLGDGEVGVEGAGGASRLEDAWRDAGACEDDGAAGGVVEIGVVADLDAGDVGDGVVGS